MGKYALKFDSNDPKSISVTEKSHKAECDINKIIARAEKTGLLPVNLDRGTFGDFSSVDFFDMNVKIAKANQAFMALPVDIRTRFGNDVGKLLAFIDDPKNIDEARKLKLLPEATLAERKAKEAAAAAAAAGAGQGAPAGIAS